MLKLSKNSLSIQWTRTPRWNKIVLATSNLKVGTPLSALIPAPESTRIFLAFANTSRKACMSLEGPSLSPSNAWRAASAAIITKITTWLKHTLRVSTLHSSRPANYVHYVMFVTKNRNVLTHSRDCVPVWYDDCILRLGRFLTAYVFVYTTTQDWTWQQRL